MKIRTFEQIAKDLENIGFVKADNAITGEDYEEWVRSRFRHLTEEEQEAYNKCLDDISEDTGISLFEGETDCDK